MRDEVSRLASVLGGALEREHDTRALAMMDYMSENWLSFREGKFTLQEFQDQSRRIWDEQILPSM